MLMVYIAGENTGLGYEHFSGNRISNFKRVPQRKNIAVSNGVFASQTKTFNHNSTTKLF